MALRLGLRVCWPRGSDDTRWSRPPAGERGRGLVKVTRGLCDLFDHPYVEDSLEWLAVFQYRGKADRAKHASECFIEFMGCIEGGAAAVYFLGTRRALVLRAQLPDLGWQGYIHHYVFSAFRGTKAEHQRLDGSRRPCLRPSRPCSVARPGAVQRSTCHKRIIRRHGCYLGFQNMQWSNVVVR